MKKADKVLRFNTAGFSAEDRLGVYVGPSQCGDILDGVAFYHDNNGAWVLSYADLMTIAEAATAARRSESPEGVGAVARAVDRVTG